MTQHKGKQHSEYALGILETALKHALLAVTHDDIEATVRRLHLHHNVQPAQIRKAMRDTIEERVENLRTLLRMCVEYYIDPELPRYSTSGAEESGVEIGKSPDFKLD